MNRWFRSRPPTRDQSAPSRSVKSRNQTKKARRWTCGLCGGLSGVGCERLYWEEGAAKAFLASANNGSFNPAAIAFRSCSLP